MKLLKGNKNKEPARVLCPFCLNMVILKHRVQELPWHGNKRVDVCPTCGQVYPKGFRIDNPEDAVILSGIGERRHGKTVYIASLFYVLRNVLTNCWPGYYVDIMDDESRKQIKFRIHQLVERRELPLPTEASFPRPTIVLQKQTHVRAAFAKQVSTLFYDTGGESFESGGTIQDYARYMAKARTALFIIGLPQLQESHYPGEMLVDLLNRYCIAMRALDADLSLQQLVIVYTKADWVMDRLPPSIREYLETGQDAYPQPEELPGYYRTMAFVSSLLHRYTKQELRARGFGHMAEQFESVRFCAVSALGHAPVDGKLRMDISPRRVLDPFLWAMNTPGTQKKKKRKLGLFGLW